MCQYSLKFLNAYIKNDHKSKIWLQNQPQEKGIPAEYVKIDLKLL